MRIQAIGGLGDMGKMNGLMENLKKAQAMVQEKSGKVQAELAAYAPADADHSLLTACARPRTYTCSLPGSCWQPIVLVWRFRAVLGRGRSQSRASQQSTALV